MLLFFMLSNTYYLCGMHFRKKKTVHGIYKCMGFKKEEKHD